jgi:hypothetical protein
MLGRLMLFALPLWLVAAGASVQDCFSGAWNVLRIMGAGVAGLVLGCALVGAAVTVVMPPKGPDTRGVMDYLEKHAQAGDTIYLLGTSAPPVRFYFATGYQAVARKCLVREGNDSPWQPRAIDEVTEYVSTARRGRVWVLCSDLNGETPSLIQQRDRTVQGFQKVAKELDRRAGRETDLILFELK